MLTSKNHILTVLLKWEFSWTLKVSGPVPGYTRPQDKHGGTGLTVWEQRKKIFLH